MNPSIACRAAVSVRSASVRKAVDSASANRDDVLRKWQVAQLIGVVLGLPRKDPLDEVAQRLSLLTIVARIQEYPAVSRDRIGVRGRRVANRVIESFDLGNPARKSERARF